MPPHVPQTAQGLALFLSICVLVMATSSAGLCQSRCEKANILLQRVRTTWSRSFKRMNGRGVSFEMFIKSLVAAAGSYPKLRPLQGPLRRMLSQYRDCIFACEHPFSKRDSDHTFTDLLVPICSVLNEHPEAYSPIFQQFRDICPTRSPGA